MKIDGFMSFTTACVYVKWARGYISSACRFNVNILQWKWVLLWNMNIWKIQSVSIQVRRFIYKFNFDVHCL